jgi:hypothetical protein
MSEKPSSWVEKAGNTIYALAVMVVPFAGVLYLASYLAGVLGYDHLYWAIPAGTLVLFLALALWLHTRLSAGDQAAKAAQLAHQEIDALRRARELFDDAHYDLSVIEAWKALDARLHRVLEARGYTAPADNPHAMLEKARKKGILRDTTWQLVQKLRRHWNVAISHDPLQREDAEAALNAARDIMASIPLENTAGAKPAV